MTEAEVSIGDSAKTCLVIVNKRSGSAFSRKHLEKLVSRQLIGEFADIQFIYTDSSTHAVDESYQACKRGTRALCVWGGDGSLHSAVNGIMRGVDEGLSSPLLIPLGGGSGSDFIRTLKLFGKARSEIRVDIGIIEIMDFAEKRFFINGFSLGVTAEIAKIKEAMPRWLPGSLKYFAATLVRLWRGNIISSAMIDQTPYSEIISGLFLTGQFVGGGMRMTTDSALNDGVFEQLIIPKMGLWSILLVLKSAYLKHVASQKPVVVGKMLAPCSIKLSQAGSFEADGETFQASHVQISVAHGALTLMYLS